MKKYEAYKDSGIEWIGQIPEGWSVVPLKYNLSLKGRIGWNGLKSEEFQEKSYAYLVTGQDFNSDVVNWEKCYQINKERYDEDPFIQLENGDLLVTKDGTIGKVAKVVNLDKPACLNSGIFVVKQTKGVFEQNYLYWVLVSNQLKEFVGFNSTGSTIAHLYQNVFENMPLTVPPLTEQKAIASYLDYKVGQIDASISAINTQIDDLKSYRQSIISEAVTKGLDPDVPMKDSGIEWIGKIPEGWKYQKTKYLFDIVSGTTPDSSNADYWDGDIPWITPADFKTEDHFVSEGKRHLTQKGYDSCGTKLVPQGSIIFSKRAPIGSVVLASNELCTNQGCLSCVSKENAESRYFYYAMSIFTDAYNMLGDGTTFKEISATTFSSFELPYPSKDEQLSIANYLDAKTSKIESAITSLEAQRDDLNALKQSIISEAVTGKIDVRDWKPNK